jgi:hypothetical protein
VEIISIITIDEHKETAVTSVKQSMLKEPSTEATGKMKSDLRTTSGDNAKVLQIDENSNTYHL